jgi:hypothetical protein
LTESSPERIEKDTEDNLRYAEFLTKLLSIGSKKFVLSNREVAHMPFSAVLISILLKVHSQWFCLLNREIDQN